MTKKPTRKERQLAKLPLKTFINNPYQKTILKSDGTTEVWWCADIEDYKSITETTYTFKMKWRNVAGEEVIYNHSSVHQSAPTKQNLEAKKLALVGGRMLDDKPRNSPYEIGAAFEAQLPHLHKSSSVYVPPARKIEELTPITSAESIPLVCSGKVLIEDDETEQLTKDERGLLELLKDERAEPFVIGSLKDDGENNWFHDARESLPVLFSLYDKGELSEPIHEAVRCFLTEEIYSNHQYYYVWKEHNRWIMDNEVDRAFAKLMPS